MGDCGASFFISLLTDRLAAGCHGYFVLFEQKCFVLHKTPFADVR